MHASGIVVYNCKNQGRTMGQLLNINEAREKAYWLFDDTHTDYGRDEHRFAWPSANFPYCVSIHEDDIKSVGTRPLINSFVTGQPVNVIYDVLDKSYRIYHSKEMDWNRSHPVSNYWYRFWFETEADSIIFSLRFSNIVQQIKDTHPTRHYVPEY